MLVGVPKVFLETPDWEEKHIRISLKDTEIEKCPDIQHHLPVSRKYEQELYKHYRTNPYWPTANIGLGGGFYPPRPLQIPNSEVSEEKIGTILRSFREVDGYQIHATDGQIGHLADLVVDDEDWQIVYGIVDTRNWMPWSKKVMIPLDAMEKISFERREVYIRLMIETIKNGPEYNPGESISEAYEQGVYDFFSSSLVK